MADNFWATLTNSLYGTSHRVKIFQDRHPDAKIIIACATKGRKLTEDKVPQYAFGWALARRDALILADTGLYCGDWEIPLANIREATLFRTTSGTVLKVLTVDGLNYQFGIQANLEWETQRILPLKIEKQGMRFSAASIILRVLAIVLFIYLVIQDFSQNGFSVTTVLALFLVYYLARPFINIFIKS